MLTWTNLNTELGQSRISQSWHHTYLGQDNNPLYDLYVLSIWRIFDGIAGLYPVYARTTHPYPIPTKCTQTLPKICLDIAKCTLKGKTTLHWEPQYKVYNINHNWTCLSQKKNPQGIITAVSLVSNFPAVFHVQTNIHMFTFANSLIFPLPNWGSFIISNIFSFKMYLFNLSLYAHSRVSAYFSRNINTIVCWIHERTLTELISYGWTFRYYQLPQL